MKYGLTAHPLTNLDPRIAVKGKVGSKTAETNLTLKGLTLQHLLLHASSSVVPSVQYPPLFHSNPGKQCFCCLVYTFLWFYWIFCMQFSGFFLILCDIYLDSGLYQHFYWIIYAICSDAHFYTHFLCTFHQNTVTHILKSFLNVMCMQENNTF